jgi:hypothetical protein
MPDLNKDGTVKDGRTVKEDNDIEKSMLRSIRPYIILLIALVIVALLAFSMISR